MFVLFLFICNFSLFFKNKIRYDVIEFEICDFKINIKFRIFNLFNLFVMKVGVIY